MIGLGLIAFPHAAPAAGGVSLSAEKPLDIRGASTVQATATNETSEAHEVRFEATVRSGDVEISVPTVPPMARLEPGESVVVQVSAPSGIALSGVYTGELVAFTRRYNARLDLTIGPVETPTLGITSRQINVYGLLPFGIPDTAVSDEWAKENRLDFGDTIDLTVCAESPNSVKAAGGLSAIIITPACDGDDLELRTSGFEWNRHSDFTGIVSSGGKDLAVTVRYSTLVVWPVIFLSLGFLAAIAVHAWINGRREMRLVRLRLVELDQRARRADALFQKASTGRSWESYRIAGLVREELAEYLYRLATIESMSPKFGLVSDGQQKRLQELVDDAAPLEAFITAWRSASEALFEPLQTQRADTSHNADWSAACGLAKWADSQLGPPQSIDLSLATYTTLVDEVGLVADALRLVDTIRYYHDRLEEVREQLEPDDERLVAADEAWASLSDRLGDANEQLVAPSDVMALAEDIKDFRTRVTALPRPTIPGPAGVRESTDDADDLEKAKTLKQISEALKSATDEDIATVRAWTIGSVDLRIAVGIALVAVWSGLQAQYFGKPWGNLVDYGSAFVWAFTATAVLTPLITFLSKPPADKFRLEKSSTDE